MQRPIIFVATADPEFESTATEAILSSHHGMRCARDLDAAGRMLASGAEDVALAIIDLDKDGVALLSILGSSELRYPILAVKRELLDLPARELVSGVAIDSLRKPVGREELRRHISQVCSCDPTESATSRLAFVAA